MLKFVYLSPKFGDCWIVDYEIGGIWGPIAKLISAERERRLTSSTFKRMLKAGMLRPQRDNFLYIMAERSMQTHHKKR